MSHDEVQRDRSGSADKLRAKSMLVTQEQSVDVTSVKCGRNPAIRQFLVGYLVGSPLVRQAERL